MSKDLYDLDLWKKFEKEEKNPQNIANVKKLIKYSSNLLDRVVETFPNYTLHNSKHSLNLVKIMGCLLGEKGLEKITSFESAILILSAYFHDIGMVFNKDEKENLEKEENFQKFLNEYPEANLKFKKNNNSINEELAEWYCRWIHPKRVFNFLNEELFIWYDESRKSSYSKEFGLLCQSHGEDIKALLKNDDISSEFKKEYDLKFCALMLRCADILDFDNSRTPENVYEYLNIDNHKSYSEDVSKTEWQKHLCSNGFKVTKDNTLFFDAEPTHPAVEYDIKKFLKIIEDELRNSYFALKKCSKNWQDFKLIYEIESDIKSKGYIYGEHKFSLEQNEVLNLLMGENLYSDSYVFIRELLQNAIDTSRHREVYERSEKYDKDFKAKAIDITEWIDIDGYRWVRIDDFGMGMDRKKIEKYFLKIGKSYYESNEFESELLSYRDNEEFKPISRFGIGILSCFIVGDRVEVSTKSFDENIKPIRLSLHGLNGFFVMQQQNSIEMKKPNFMPNKTQKSDEFYRKEVGTSIAIRIQANKETNIQINDIFKNYLHYTPIEVKYLGKKIAKTIDEININPWIDKKIVVNLDKQKLKQIETFLNEKDFNFQIEIIPIDISSFSVSNNLKGQILIGIVKTSLVENKNFHFKFEIEGNFRNGNNNVIIIEKKEKDRDKWKKEIIILDEINDYLKLKLDSETNGYISHNGVIFSELKYYPRENGIAFNHPKIGFSKAEVILMDDLRANLSVSRDKIINFNWKTISILSLTFSKILKKYDLINHFDDIYILGNVNKSKFKIKDILGDSLIYREWHDEPIFYVNKSLITLNEIKNYINNNKHVNIENIMMIKDVFFTSSSAGELIRSFIASTIAQLFLDLRLVIEEEKYNIKAVKLKDMDKNLKYFRPMFFIYYETSNKLRIKGYPLNYNHKFSKWLIENTEKLIKNYSGIFNAIENYLYIIYSPSINGKKIKKADTKKEIIEPINNILNRLETLDKNFFDEYPKDKILLKEDDFEF